MQIGCHKDNDDDTAACKSQCVLIYAASKHSWIKQLACCYKRLWSTNLVCLNLCFWSKALHSFSSNFCLAVANMVLAKKKLPVQVAGLYCIHVNLHSTLV